MAETTHTFVKGMDMDTDKVFRSNEVTYKLENFRLVTEQTTDARYAGGTTGAIENIKGNTVITYTANPYVTVKSISGTCLVRDYLVLFGIDTNDASFISYLRINDNDTIETDSFTLVYSDYYNGGEGTLDFPTTNLKAVGRYESSSLIKVYWADDVNTVKFINIVDNNTTDGGVFDNTNFFLPTHKLEFLPNFYVSNLSSVEVINGGSLKAGRVQYTYQLYDRFGAETAFAPLTNPVHIVAPGDSSASTLLYYGSDIDENCGKSVKLTYTHLSENDTYERLKIVRIFYDTLGGLPEVDLVADVNISAIADYIAIDTGVSLYSYTPEEIAVLQRTMFIAKDLAIKDDRLFAGNITNEDFDVDFDARAFRFENPAFYNGKATWLRNDGADVEYELTSDSAADWDVFLGAIGEDNDCINLFNDLTYDDKTVYFDAKYECIYQYNSIFYGGTGKNVKYEFITESFVLDNDSNTTKTSASNTSARTTVAGTGTGDNYSFSNFASPYMCQEYTGYARGEIYRFGIIFYDIKGRASKVKWVGDIRFPTRLLAGNIAELNATNIESDSLGIKFYVRNVPSDAVAWSIVRVNRESSDKTLLSQGVISSILKLDTGANDYYYLMPFPSTGIHNSLQFTNGSHNGYWYNTVLQYQSPTIDYNTFEYKEGDYFEELGYYNDYCTYNAELNASSENVMKYVDVEYYTLPNRIEIDNTITIVPTSEEALYSIGNINVGNTNIITNGSETYNKGISGTSILFTYFGTFEPTSSSEIFSPVVANLRRINNSQYGGNTYEARFNNEYISCGKVIYSGDVEFTTGDTYVIGVDVYGGDTYITMYEKLHSLYVPDDYEMCRVYYAPLESEFNLNLNNGFTYSKNIDQTNIELIRETSGTHSDSTDYTLEQDEMFYKYNTVYSYNNPIVKFYPNTDLDNDTLEYDYRVVVSEPKINNENIDNWTKFLVSNYLDVDSSYGELQNLINLKDQIYFLQTNGLGVLSINRQALITTETSAAPLVLGTGGILDRYDYYSTYYGNKHFKGPVTCESGIYWIDKNELLLFNGETVIPLSKTKMIDSFFKQRYNQITRVVGTYYTKYNEVWMKIEADTEDLGILAFNELLAIPEAFFTIPAYDFIPLKTEMISIYKKDAESVYKLYMEDSNNNRGVFYDTTHDSVIWILSTEGYPSIKVWDNIEYSSFCRDIYDAEYFADTFSSFQVYNNYQNTDEITLTKDDNLRRREMNWTIAIPRSVVSGNVSDMPNIHDSLNLDSTQLFKERIRSNYIMLKMTYTNGNNRAFTVPYITLRYRVSNR